MSEPASPDPVTDPSGYQRHLLGLLGDDDPAEVQAATTDAWRVLVEQAGAHLRERPEPAEWSVLECLGHAADAEIVYSGRYRWIIAHDQPPLIGYDQDLWVDRLHHGDDDPVSCSPSSKPCGRRTSRSGGAARPPSGTGWACTPSAGRRARVGISPR